MLKVTDLQWIHTKARSKKRPAERKHSTHTHTHTQQDVMFKAICYSQRDAEFTPVFAIKDTLSLHEMCVSVRVSSHHTCITCTVVSGYFWTWKSRVTLDTWVTPEFSFFLICVWFWLRSQALTQWLVLPAQREVEGPEEGKTRNGEHLCSQWNRRKYEWWRERRT